MPIELDHIVLEVRDVEVSVQFYGDLLGLKSLRLRDFLAGGAPFPSSRVNRGTLIDFFPRNMWRKSARAQNPHHFCFTMKKPEVDSVKRRLKKMGVEITMRHNRSYGARGWARSIYFHDPDGITVEVRYYPPPRRKAGS